MAATLAHRGPDATGVWVSSRDAIALGQTRLAVVDLSPSGQQPMSMPDGRWVITYNGEIYNAEAIRRDLVAAGSCLRGTSDTEVLLSGIARWGLRPTLERVDGMFAFAAWDAGEKVLHLARDRMGEKPLYYGWSGSTFLFGSELKALRAHAGLSLEIDRDSLALMLATGYVPGPRSIYRGIRKLQPGCGVSISIMGHQKNWKYWDVRAVAVSQSNSSLRNPKATLVERANTLLAASVRRELVADVPVGAMLSGGVDSSLVVALAQQVTAQSLQTFTIGFSEPEYDEAPYARAVASYLGTNHTEVIVTPEEAIGVIQDLPHIYDEPFGDSSQIPTVLVARIARQSVTVALTGDGGDELFGGYQRYGVHGLIGRTAVLPVSFRSALGTMINRVPSAAWSVVGRSRLGAHFPGGTHRLQERVRKGTALLAMEGMDQFAYAAMMMQSLPSGASLVSGASALSPFMADVLWDRRLDRLGRMRLLDQVIYLPDDLLVKIDRAAMSTSLETRAPMLSREIVEFAWSLDSSVLRRRGQGKWVLREVLRRYLPSALFERPKMGFGVPIGQWLRGPMRPWAEDLFASMRTDPIGLVNVDFVDTLWRAHLDESEEHSYSLWHLLMFQAWRETAR